MAGRGGELSDFSDALKGGDPELIGFSGHTKKGASLRVESPSLSRGLSLGSLAADRLWQPGGRQSNLCNFQ